MLPCWYYSLESNSMVTSLCERCICIIVLSITVATLLGAGLFVQYMLAACTAMAMEMAEIEPISVPRWAGLVHCKKLGGAQDCTNCAGCSDHITTSYKSDYEGKRPAARMPLRPSSLTRKHNPQPRHVFLLRRAVPNKVAASQ